MASAILAHRVMAHCQVAYICDITSRTVHPLSGGNMNTATNSNGDSNRELIYIAGGNYDTFRLESAMEETHTGLSDNKEEGAGMATPAGEIEPTAVDMNSQKEDLHQKAPKSKGIKLQLDSPKYATLIKKVKEMFAKNIPMEEITQNTEITEKQALKILAALIEEKKIKAYNPPYFIVPAKSTVKRLFSKFGVDFENVRVTYNENGSITIIPVRQA